MSHVPVLFKESIDLLSLVPGLTVVDGTLGGGGHAREILKRISPNGILIGLDQDQEVIDRLQKSLHSDDVTIILENTNFKNIRTVCDHHQIPAVDRAFFDLGFSSLQMDNPERGLSFMKDGPLDMRLDTHVALTAADIVNQWDEEALADLFYVYGDERKSRQIARAIATERRHKSFLRTTELADTIARAIGRRGKIHPATRVFQALRIAVNDELGVLREGLDRTWELLAPSGIMAIISFHSGEDRIVKTKFKEWASLGEGTLLTKKPIAPARAEAKENPRSRSAKLRGIKKA